MELPLDRYSLRARVAPALVVFLPLFLAGAAWMSAPLTPPEGVGWTLGLGLMALLSSQFVRDAGFKKEPRLYARWGGAPTTRFLRHRDSTLEPQTKARYHSRLAQLVPESHLPTPEQEAHDPGAADQAYVACVRFLRANTQDKAIFARQLEANIDYGFRRNLWAVKATGIAVAGIGTLAATTRVVVLALDKPSAVPLLASTCGFLSLLLLLWWIFRIRVGWVALAAEAYALQLLSACDILQPTQQPASHQPPRIITSP